MRHGYVRSLGPGHGPDKGVGTSCQLSVGSPGHTGPVTTRDIMSVRGVSSVTSHKPWRLQEKVWINWSLFVGFSSN